MPRDFRRVITGHNNDGKSIVVIDETMTAHMGHVLTPEGQPNVRLSDVWISRGVPDSNTGNDDTVEEKVTLQPPAGGAVFRTLEIPPDSERNFGAMRRYFEQMDAGDRLEGKQHPGMHQTDSVDYLIIISGEVWMILDEEEILLKQGDTCVQRGTLHAWSNRSNKPCTLAGVLIDAAPLN
ncbi:MAG: quercetin dioxygenase-like cupin family protein [Alphaproteobacteria bacterium]|jgi:quercetin dioxygenase-like cupin family protein